MADQYLLHVTAGPSYDPSTHTTVAVNTSTPTSISSPHCSTSLSIRIRNYRGLPHTSPSSDAYFSHPTHHGTQFSLSLSFTPKTSTPATSLLFGNDFDKPIRDRLPPGFGAALKIFQYAVDPGAEGDVYADKPYLYGRALGSWNTVWVGGKEGSDADKDTAGDDEENGEIVTEGGNKGGLAWRHVKGVPEDAGGRMKWGRGYHAESWEWEAGREYRADFFNGMLDFNDFSLRLPGFHMLILPYLGGGDSLRFALKNKETGDVWLVVVFTLVHKEDAEKEVEEKEGKEERKKEKPDGKGDAFEPSPDDLD